MEETTTSNWFRSILNAFWPSSNVEEETDSAPCTDVLGQEIEDIKQQVFVLKLALFRLGNDPADRDKRRAVRLELMRLRLELRRKRQQLSKLDQEEMLCLN